jgi:Raf kinase inhibitor-like YbhB/YbcL family protein
MKTQSRSVRAAALPGILFALLAGLPATALADGKAPPFRVSSTAFADGHVIPNKYGGDFNGCTGQNVSPPLSWRNAPAETQSFAVVLFDVDGAKSSGVTHWIAYAIPPAVRSLAENAGATTETAFAAGRNMRDSLRYAGPCPRPGDSFHHYVFTVYALDLATGALAKGLDYQGFKSAIAGHVLVATSLVGRVERPAVP